MKKIPDWTAIRLAHMRLDRFLPSSCSVHFKAKRRRENRDCETEAHAPPHPIWIWRLLSSE
jgi:hypothetical protein